MKTISFSQRVAAAVNAGGTGDSPVPVGDPPTGMGRARGIPRLVEYVGSLLPFRPASGRTAQAGRLCYPSLWIFLGCLLASSTFAQVNRTIGTLPPGGTVTITFDVTINTPFPANTASVTNQGSVSANAISTILTDNPAVGGASDPTVTAVFVAPQITCPPDITTNAAGYCPPTIAFAATVTAGVPAPVVTYKIGAAVITSPYTFPIGTNTVTSTATNVAGTNTCNFTVKVAAGAAPQLSIVRSSTNMVVSWSNSFPCYTLQFAPKLASNTWSSYPGPFTTNGGKIFVTNSAAITNRFFRLSF